MGMTVPKPLVMFNGRPFVNHVVDAFRPLVNRVIVLASSCPAWEAWRRANRGASVISFASQSAGVVHSFARGMQAIADQPHGFVWVAWADMLGWTQADAELLVKWVDVAAYPGPGLTQQAYHWLPLSYADHPYVPLSFDGDGNPYPTSANSRVQDCGVFGFNVAPTSLAEAAEFCSDKTAWWPFYSQLVYGRGVQRVLMPPRCGASANTQEDMDLAYRLVARPC
jgi:hypothetical protein